MIYNQIIEKLHIKPGDKIWLSSDMTQIMLSCLKNGVPFDLDAFLNSFQEVLGSAGTLIIPTFNFDFSNKGYYDYRDPKCFTGALGITALKRPDFKRTLHPMHSFAVWGKDKDYLCSMKNSNSFGNDSPFGFCLEQNIKQIMLCTDYTRSFTFAHFAEFCCKVPYRFEKTFTGTYVDENGHADIRAYDYYARRLDVGTSEQFNRLGELFAEKGLSDSVPIMESEALIVQLGDVFSLICDDIKYNQCRRLYDFEIPREQIFHEP